MALFGPNVEKLKESRDISGLIKALENKKPEIRKEAADALADIGGEEALPGLLTALQDTNARVRVYAVQGLAKTKGAKAQEALQKVVTDPDWEVRKEALSALVKSGSNIEVMLQAMQFNSAELRELAAVRLGETGGPEAMDALIRALKDEEELVRLRASNALKKMMSDKNIDSATAERIRQNLNR